MEDKNHSVNAGTKHSSGEGELSPRTPDRSKLTPEQIKNWRTAMIGMLGGYALIMPDEDVQRLRDRMQEIANANSKTSGGDWPLH